jgi:HK97 family phage major capsid protein
MKLDEKSLRAMIREVVTEVVKTKDHGKETVTQAVDDLFAGGKETAIAAAQKALDLAKALKGDKGTKAGRFIRALAGGKGDPEKAARFAAKHYGADDPVVKVLEASDYDSGGVLVPTEYSNDMIELLREVSVVRAAGPVVIPMDTGSIEIPKQTGGSAGAYLGETQNIANSEPTFGSMKLVWKKLGVVVPVSNDLLRFSAIGADTLVRNDAVFGVRETEEVAFLRSPGSEHTPKGLLYHCPDGINNTLDHKFDAQTSYNLAKVTQDTAAAILKLRNGLSRMIAPAWFWAPRTDMYLKSVRDSNGNFAFRDELLAGTFWGFPYFSTTNIPINLGSGNKSEIYLVDMADVLLGESNFLQVDASNTAAYHDGTSVVSAFSKDQTVVRVIAHHDLGVRHPESLAVIEAVDWSPTA